MPDRKNEIVDRILERVGLEAVGETTGSTGRKSALIGVVDAFNLPLDAAGRKPALARAIVEGGGLEWIPGPPNGHDSTLSPSGGGDTVTVAGWLQVERAVALLESGQVPLEAAEVDRAVRGARNAVAGAGRLADGERRRLVERRAVDVATELMKARDYRVEDVGDHQSFDLLCTGVDGRRLDVEVKGTQGNGSAVLLTSNEVAHADAMETTLVVVHGIRIEGSSAVGGTAHVLDRWQPNVADLTPTVYRYDVPGL